VNDKIEQLRAIERAASGWLAAQKLDMLDDQRQRELQAWLDEDPENAAVYHRMLAAWEDCAVTRALLDMDSKRSPVQRQGGEMPPHRESIRFWKLRPVWSLAATAVLLIMSTVVIYLTKPAPSSQVASGAISTAPAEIRELTLADGSVVTLGARSWITVDLNEKVRRIILLAGEAYFSVASDPTRPFIVDAGDARIEVVGTRFEVSLIPEGVTVSVAEGIVELIQSAPVTAADDSSGQPAEVRKILKKGEKAVASPQMPEDAVTPVDVDVPGAWRKGRLIYQNARLDQVIADARRYYTGRIVLASPELGDLRVTATFGSDDITAIIHLISEQMPVTVEWRDNGDAVLFAAQRQ